MNTINPKNKNSYNLQKTDNGGTVTEFSYITKDYINGNTDLSYEKRALVYLPKEYSPDKKYNVFYLLHGGNDDETWYFSGAGRESDMKNLLDNMIEDKILNPCIVCTPTYQSPYSDDHTQISTTRLFYKELVNDLIPALESRYSTYYESSENNLNTLKSSRMHRAFGGFSMGCASTWWVFSNALYAVGYFMPMSGDCWEICKCGGGTETSKTADYLENSVKSFNMTAKDFFIYAGNGDTIDIAYANMAPQIEEMKKRTDTFKYCRDSFEEGNFIYNVIPNGNHVINTAYRLIYSGLPLFF